MSDNQVNRMQPGHQQISQGSEIRKRANRLGHRMKTEGKEGAEQGDRKKGKSARGGLHGGRFAAQEYA